MSTYPPQQTPNSTLYLVWSIIVTVVSVLSFCLCLPLLAVIPGIVAIVFAAKINGHLNAGRPLEAAAAAKTAKLWSIIATVVLVISYIAYFGFLFSGVGKGFVEEYQRYQQEQLNR